MSDAPVPWRVADRSVRLVVRVTPNVGSDRIEGIETRDEGTACLRIRVKAVPDRGRANTSVITVLAKALGIPKGAITLVSGDTARLKTLALVGDAGALMASLRSLTVTEP